MKGRAGTVALIMLLVILAPPAAVVTRGADTAHVREAFVINSQSELLLYFSLGDVVSPEMEKGILNGIPLTIAFFVELYEQQPGKGAVQIVGRNFQHTLHFETLKEVFVLEQSEQGRKPRTIATLAEATEALLRVHDVPVAALTLLKPGLTYGVKIKAELAKQGLPDKFKNVMTLLKIWDFKTEWHEIVFSMAPTPAVEQ